MNLAGKALSIVCLFTLILAVHGQIKEKCTQPVPSAPITIGSTQTGRAMFTFTGYRPTVWVQPINQKITRKFGPFFELKKTGRHWTFYHTKSVNLEGLEDTFNNSIGLELDVKIYCRNAGTGMQKVYSLTVFVIDDKLSRIYMFLGKKVYHVNEDALTDDEVARLIGVLISIDGKSTAKILSYEASSFSGNMTDAMEKFDLAGNGDLILRHHLDYTTGDHIFGLNITAKGDNAQANEIITIVVVNVDSHPPMFIYDGCVGECIDAHFTADIESSFVGDITDFVIGPVKASDGDDEPLFYEIIGGSPENYDEYLSLDNSTGDLSIIKSVEELGLGLLDVVIRVTSIGGLPSGSNPPAQNAFSVIMIWVMGYNFDFQQKGYSMSDVGQLVPDLTSVCVAALMASMGAKI